MKGFKGYGILIFLLFWSAGAGAQVVLEGKVSSSEGEPLELAHVVAYKNGARKVAGFATTSKKGNYSLKLNEYGVYDVRYSFMGCKARMLTLRLEAGTKIFRKDVVLQVDEKMLSEVELVYNVPVKQSGDTTSYKAESFSSGKEKKLEDVLNNLPGVEVNDEGQVEVEGVQVQKVLVEGKNFFSGDSKLAAKNIPSNVVEEVQVIKNFTEVAMMKGLESTEDDIALNIKLKEGKKEFWFGETEAGGGVKEKSALYLVNPKLFYYSPDFNVSFIGSLTNTGRPPFTPRDFRALMGGSQKLNMKSGTSISGATNTLGLSSMRNNRAKQLDSEFGALNLSYSPSSSVDWSGFLIFSASDMLTEEYSLREYIKSGAREDNRQTVNQQSNLYVLKTEMNYHPDSDTQLDYELFVKYSDFSETLANQSAVNGQTAREIGENKEERPLSVLQNLTYYKTLAPAHILSVSGQYSYENENPYYSIETPDEVFPGLLPVDYTQDQARVVQDKTVKSHKLDTKADYFWKFDQLSNINLTLGNLYSRQQFSSSLFQTLADGKEETFGDEFSNDVSYTFSDLFLSARYRRQIGKVTLTPGLSVHQFYLADRQESTASSTEYGLLPSLNILTQFKSSVLLELDYAMKKQYTDVNKLVSSYMLSSYNSLYAGNRKLEAETYHRLRLTYRNFNLFYMSSFFARFSYTRKLDALKGSSEIEGVSQLRSTVNASLPDETIAGHMDYSKNIGKLKLSGKANVSYASYYGLVNGGWEQSEAVTQSYQASAGTFFTDLPNLTLGFRYGVNRYLRKETTTYRTQRPFARLELPVGKSLTLKADYSYYDYRNAKGTVKNTYQLLNGQLVFEKSESPWEFMLELNNLLNTRSISQDSINEYYTVSNQYFIQPAFALLSVKYKL